MEKQGVFYAVSVGPGDPELLTGKPAGYWRRVTL